MKKKNASRIISLLVAALMLFVFVSDSVFNKYVSADNTGEKPNYITQDNYDDLYVYKYKDKDFYFADSYFAKPGTEYNSHLATVSVYAADRSGDFGGIKENATEKDIEDWCNNQPKSLKAFWETIGFTEFDCNEDYVSRSRFDSIGVGVAQRKINVNGTDYTVLSVCPRSGSSFREWANNVWLGDGKRSDYMHEGWYNAANKLIDYLKQYVKEHKVTGKVKLWMTGFSRGGATTNIAAGLLDNRIDQGEKIFGDEAALTHDDIYAYTFEAPQGANINSKTVKSPKNEIYNNIWNIVNPLDIVPKVAMSQYGFTRFGTDLFITTQFYDPDNYKTNRHTFEMLYKSIKGDWADYTAEKFEMYGMTVADTVRVLGKNFLKGFGVGYLMEMVDKEGLITRDYTKENYDANFVFMLIMEEVTKNVGSREDYCNNLQNSLSNLLLIFSDDKDGAFAKNKDKAIEDIISVVILTAIGTLSIGLKNSLVKYNEAQNIIDNNRVLAEVDRCLEPLLKTVAPTYWNKPNELISFGLQAGNVMKNHNTDITLAHVMSQDSYYIDSQNAKSEVAKKTADRVVIVPLMDNADYGRMSFDNFNDVQLYLDGSKKVDIEGHILGKSDVHTCAKGFAAGYYSYATEEKMEVFFPVNKTVNVSFKSYSKKFFKHTDEYWAFYQPFALGDNAVILKHIDNVKETCRLNSERYDRTVKATK